MNQFRAIATVVVLLSILLMSRCWWVTRNGALFHYHREHASAWELDWHYLPDGLPNPDGTICYPPGTTIYSVTGKRHVLGQYRSLDGAIIQALLGYIPEV